MSEKTGSAELPKYQVFIAEEYDQQLKKFPSKDRAFIEKKMIEKIYKYNKTISEGKFSLN